MWTEFKLRGGRNGAAHWLARYMKRDDGTFTVFGLFIFLMIIMISGIAVDMMRYEYERVGVQNTLDTAVVAATRLNQDANTNEAVTALVKDYFAKAGYDPDMVQVNPNIEVPAGGTEETLRTVSARVDFSMNTAFMNMVGIDELPGIVGGGAREGQQLVEIALVLDISGSMGWGTKLEDMQEAAKSFVTMVLANNGPERVMISIIPYNAQVKISADLAGRLDNNIADRLKWDNTLSVVTPEPTHPGAILQYNTHNAAAHCASFLDEDFDTRELALSGELNGSGLFSDRDHDFNQVPDWSYWCKKNQPEMLLYQNDETKIHDFIDSLQAGGWTAIDYGMKWGVGVLDPTFRPIIQDMLADSNNLRTAAQEFASTNGTSYEPPSETWIVEENVAGHPVNYGTPNVFKYVVLMTDGANTEHKDLKDEYKSGPTRIWRSEARADQPGNDWWDGFLVEMPENLASQRWYAPGSPNSTGDDTYLSEAEFAALDPAQTEQWSYHRLYDRFTVEDAAWYFFRYSDWDAYTAHDDAIMNSGGYGVADGRLARVCDQAQTANAIEVFTVAFEAPEEGVAALQRCSELDPGNFFLTSGDQLTEAFEAIAAEITKLRLTQ